MMLITGKSRPGLRGLLTACTLALGLASCSTMSEKECQFANWRDIGLTDGLAGKSLGLLNERRSDCAEANIQLDQKAYLKGREEGLKTYCQLGNAVHLGLRGEPYEGVCPAAIEPEDGAVVQAGTPEDLVLSPADGYVAEFTRNVSRAKVLKVASLMKPAWRASSRLMNLNSSTMSGFLPRFFISA